MSKTKINTLGELKKNRLSTQKDPTRVVKKFTL